VIGGGDLNFIRSVSDKSMGVGNVGLINAFNTNIENLNLRDFHRGAKYNWTNKQENLI
jgi:hypothetical protein